MDKPSSHPVVPGIRRYVFSILLPCLMLTQAYSLPTVSFRAATSTGTESCSGQMFVDLSTTSVDTISVPFTVNSSSTAVNGVDYTITATPLVFYPGETSLSIISVIPHGQVDSDKTITIDLGTPTNAVLGSPSSSTHTIINDNTAPVGGGLYTPPPTPPQSILRVRNTFGDTMASIDEDGNLGLAPEVVLSTQVATLHRDSTSDILLSAIMNGPTTLTLLAQNQAGTCGYFKIQGHLYSGSSSNPSTSHQEYWKGSSGNPVASITSSGDMHVNQQSGLAYESKQLLRDPGFELWSYELNTHHPLDWTASNGTCDVITDFNTLYCGASVTPYVANLDTGGVYAMDWHSVANGAYLETWTDSLPTWAPLSPGLSFSLKAKGQGPVGVEMADQNGSVFFNQNYTIGALANSIPWTTITETGITSMPAGTTRIRMRIKDVDLANGDNEYYLDDAALELLPPCQKQWVSNPGFEIWTGGSPSAPVGWYLSGGVTGTPEHSANNVHSDSTSLKWVTSTQWCYVQNRIAGQNFAALPNTKMDVSFYVKGTGQLRVYVQGEKFDKSIVKNNNNADPLSYYMRLERTSSYLRNDSGNDYTVVNASTGDWQHVTVSGLQVPDGLDAISLILKNSAADPSTYYIDDVAFDFTPVNNDGQIAINLNSPTHNVIGIGWNINYGRMDNNHVNWTGTGGHPGWGAVIQDMGIQFARLESNISHYTRNIIENPTTMPPAPYHVDTQEDDPDDNDRPAKVDLFLALAEERNIQVLVNNWNCGGLYEPKDHNKEDYWWVPYCCNYTLPDNYTLTGKDSWDVGMGPLEYDYPAHIPEWVGAWMTVLEWYQTSKQYTCIKYFGIWNEPDDDHYRDMDGDGVPDHSFPSDFYRFYEDYGDALTSLSFETQHPKIGLLGWSWGDATTLSNDYDEFRQNVDNIGVTLSCQEGEPLSGLYMDEYIDVIDTHLYSFLTNQKSFIHNMRTQVWSHDHDGTLEPIIIDELGSHIINGGSCWKNYISKDNMGAPRNIEILENMMLEFKQIISILKEGACAVALWEFNSDPGPMSRIGAVLKNDNYYTLNSANYSPTRLWAKPLPSTSTARQSVQTDVRYTSGYLDAMTIKYVDDGQTQSLIWLVNDSASPRKVALDFGSSLGGSKTFYKFEIDLSGVETESIPDSTYDIHSAGSFTVNTSNHVLNDELCRRCLVVYTENARPY